MNQLIAFLETHTSRISLQLCVQMCVNITDLTQLSEGGGGYVDVRMVGFHIFNMYWMKEIYFVNYILPGPWILHKNHTGGFGN